MDHSKSQQNFDSRTLALLNRLASRRQNMPSTPGARPESGKGDAGGAAGGGKGPQVGPRGAAVSPGMHRGPPVDLSGKGSVNQVQRPTSAARIEHIRLQGKQDRHGPAASGGPANGGMNIQGRFLNLQMNRDGSARTPGDPIAPNAAAPGLGARLGTPAGPKLGFAGAAGGGGGDHADGGSVPMDRVATSPTRLLRGPSDKGAGAHDDEEKGASVSVRRSAHGEPGAAGGSGAAEQHARTDSSGGAAAAASAGPLVVCRSKDEKFANPERLNLDRRKLTSCPILEGEERLRLLNYQNNFITRVENLDNLPNLIFLDLYNNQLRYIQSLTHVTTLRVLMLGKNHLQKIEGLQTLTRLDVLDLHSNQITTVEHLNHLPELRVLNLAGNQIVKVENLEGLVSLTELNLRRNQIQQMHSLDTLPNLQRVFVSNNLLSSFESLHCIFMTKTLLELALDGNPVAQESGYRQVVLDNLKSLRHLDLKRVTEEERRLASVQARKVEERIQDEMRKELAMGERQEAIRQVQSEWDLECRTRQNQAHAVLEWSEGNRFADVRGSRGYIDVQDAHLHVFGRPSDGFDRVVNGVMSVHIQCVSLPRLNTAFVTISSVSTLTRLALSHNNMLSLCEVNPVSFLSRLISLNISDNPLCNSPMLRPYVIFRVHGLQEFNSQHITATERSAAQQHFAPISKLLSKYMVGASHQNFSRIPLAISHLGFGSMPGVPDVSSAIQTVYRPSMKEKKSNQQVARAVTDSILTEATASAAAIETLHTVWPSILRSLVESTVAEIEDEIDLLPLYAREHIL